MKLLLDTAYLLPAVGISIKTIPKDALIKLNAQGHKIAVSEITIFELSAKAAKYINSNELYPERVMNGIRALTFDESITRIPTHQSEVLLTAFEFRRIMIDFIDCVILSTALNHCDTLVTEDKFIKGLCENKHFLEIRSSINPAFKIQSYLELQNDCSDN